MTVWVVFILLSCGPGCIEITAEPAESKVECLSRVEPGPVVVVTCEERRDG